MTTKEERDAWERLWRADVARAWCEGLMVTPDFCLRLLDERDRLEAGYQRILERIGGAAVAHPLAAGCYDTVVQERDAALATEHPQSGTRTQEQEG